jgi:hypothetical protein
LSGLRRLLHRTLGLLPRFSALEQNAIRIAMIPITTSADQGVPRFRRQSLLNPHLEVQSYERPGNGPTFSRKSGLDPDDAEAAFT